jgi:arabinose-5-phosphate isomerase
MNNKTNKQLAKGIIKKEISSLTRTLNKIGSDFDKACDLLATHSGKIITIGLGKSGYIAMKMAATLSSTGTPSVFIHATEALHGDMGAIQNKDIVIMYSNSGETQEIIKLLPSLKILKCKIISITGDMSSKLAKCSDLTLDASVTREACPNGLAPSSSIICALALSDALALTVSTIKRFTMRDFAKTHPAGSLGRRLLVSVSDIMITKNIPTLNSNSTFSELLKVTAKRNLGIALVVNNKNKLSGVITDGDIKRIMTQHKNYNELLIGKLMTKNPFKIKGDVLAAEALAVLEKNNLNALPVMDKSKIVGIITIQDIIKSLR